LSILLGTLIVWINQYKKFENFTENRSVTLPLVLSL